MLDMNDAIRTYLSEIGRKGGKRSRRALSEEDARAMVRVREARRAYRRFHAMCFWSSPPDLAIGKQDVDWVVQHLRRNGNREAWDLAARLAR